MRSRLIYIIAFLIFLLNTDFILGTTPPNDNCVNASDISIGKDGFGFGVFKSKTINISDATVQPGEYFDPVLLSSGNNKKSVWFKFTIPTTRGVKIELKQKGGSIPENGAGFVTYYSSGKNPPGSTDITTSKITPMGQFGSAFNPCLYAGTYYIQVGANNNSNDSIYIELSVTRPNNLNSYDYTSSALDFGVVPDFNSAYYTFDAGCQTIDTISEVCSSVLGADYKDYTSTAWFTFNTGDAFDYLKFNLGLKNFGQPYSSSNPLVIGYKIYKGNVKKDGLSRITLFRDCSKFEQTSATLPNFQFNCSELQPHTSYTVQVFFNKFFSGTILTYINKIGRVTNAPNPRNIPFSNKDIILNHSNAGITNTFNDAFGCNSFMKDYLCGTVVPLNYSYNKLIYDMNTWYTFTLQKDANLVISAKCSGILVYMRLYKGNVSSDCNLSLYSDFASNTSMTCIPAGSYSLQLLGVSGQGSASDILYDVNSQLGRDIALNVTVTDAVSINRFNLSDANSVNRLSLNPIKSDTIIYALSDTFGCQNTVLPIGPQCDTLVNKAIYRVISLDRDGILTVDKRDDKIPYRIYSGDVSTLASVQNKFKPTDRISGLTIIKPCSGNGSSFKFCVSKGTYTIVSFGNDRDLNTPDPQLVVRYNTIKSYFKDTLHPEDMGDITDKFNFGRFYSKTDYVSCENNSITIDNLAPCSNYNNLIYRQFYINKEKVFSLSGVLPFRLFSGNISSGTSSLKAMTSDCKMSWNREYCLSLQPGWYTIVSYGSNLSNDNLGDPDSITVTPERKPKHNRPYKAAFNKLDWGTSTSGTKYPSTGKYIVLDNDVFNCVPDTPIAGACSGKFQKVVYYSFTIARNSFIAIKDVPSEMKVKVFPFDVRTDSALLYTASPIQPCISSAPYSIQFCNLQPGSYTLVIYAIPVSIRWVQPTVYIDRVEDSRFDNAYNAYDFGKVVGDNTFHYGKVGDVNAFDTGRNPTNDFISCKTGAQPTDPDNYYTDLTNKNHCNTGIYPYSGSSSIKYPSTVNDALYFKDSLANYLPRRNLWYTFVSTGYGSITINVINRTPGDSIRIPFSVYESNADYNLSFKELLTKNLFDSTKTGLKFIGNSQYYDLHNNCNLADGFAFSMPVCAPLNPKRYFIIVDNNVELFAPRQIDVAIRYDSIPAHSVIFNDYFADADFINGLDETHKPYSKVNLDTGIYSGNYGSFACAGKSISDGNICGIRTLWYAFDIDQPCLVRINYSIQNQQDYYFDNNNLLLYMEKVPGDSDVSSMQPVPLSTVYYNSQKWGQHLLLPGRYYIMFTGCSYSNEAVKPHVWIIRNPGDYCDNAVNINLNGVGSSSGSLSIDSHTIGESFGESGLNMNCLFGPAGYKSSWFKVHLETNKKVDVTFKMKNHTSVLPGQIRYRVLYGRCDAMSPGSCNSDALSEFTLNCMLSGDYFIQIVTPENATGSLDFNISSKLTTDSNCIAIDPTKPHADFYAKGTCSGDTTKFTNNSSQGSVIRYFWNFGYKNITSNTLDTLIYYPPTTNETSYVVKLIVLDTVTGKSDTAVKNIIMYPIPDVNIFSSLNKPVCIGSNDILTVKTKSTESLTYFWSNDSTGENVIIYPQVRTTYTVTASNVNACTGTSYIVIDVSELPIANAGQGQTICKNSFATLTASGGATYSWNNNKTTSKIKVSPEVTTTYYVTVTDNNSCTSSDKVIVNVDTINLNTGAEHIICKGNCDSLSATAVSNFSGSITYSWSNGNTGQKIKVCPSSFSSYEVTATDQNGCIASAKVNVNVELFSVDAGSDRTVCSNSCISLTSNEKLKNNNKIYYLWSNNETDQTINICPSSTTVYSVTATDLNGCTATDNVTIFTSKVEVNAGTDKTICINTCDTLNAIATTTYNSKIDYIWNNSSNGSSIKVCPAENTTYMVKAIDQYGCIATDGIIVYVTNISVNTDGDKSICDKSCDTLSVVATANPDSKITYSWSDGSSGQHIRICPVAATTKYTVTATTSEGCSATGQSTITLKTIIVTPEDSLSVCEKASAQLKATSNVYPVQFNWNGPDGFTSVVKDPVVENVDSSKAGNYIVVATDGKCFSQPAYLYLGIKSIPQKPSLLSGIDTSVCEGAYIKLKMLPVAGATYSWTGPDNFRSILLEPVIPKATTADSGIYYAHYIINSCMSFPATFKLKIYANPVASFTQNTNSGDRPLQVMFFNSSINAERYLWNFGDTSFSDIVSPLHIYNNTGNYTVKLIAYNHAGCADSATSALIHVKDIANLYIPNSFSPNQDGLNDIFRVKGFDIVWLNAYIYNRWGNLIYEWHDINGGWDGRYKGEIAPAGIYVYVIDCLGTNKEKHHYNGTITLIR